MADAIKTFLCDASDTSLLCHVWDKWLRSFTLYLASEEITDDVKKRNKLLHLGGPQSQEVVFNIRVALLTSDGNGDDKIYDTLVEGERFQ